MRGSADAIDLIDLNPADLAGRFTHLGRVDQDDNVRPEAAELRGPVFRGVTRVHNQDRGGVKREAFFGQSASDQDPGRVIRAEKIADPKNSDPGRSILPGWPLLQQLA